MENLVQKAQAFAEKAHQNHTENDSLKTPYIFHLRRVAALVELSGGSNEEIAAAWLHDTIEDTSVSFEDIEREFGGAVAGIVRGLTDLPGWDNLEVFEKKKAQAGRISKESNSVKRVKICDQMSGGELDAHNELLGKAYRKTKLEGVRLVAQACAGVSVELDKLFEAVYQECKWYLESIDD